MTSNLQIESCSVQGYLDRIGYSGPLDGSAETLAALQEAHVLTVPYENLDIFNGKYLSIDIPDVYEKVVVKKRGGYCFELNGLFAWLLRELKYDVTEYYGRFLLGEPMDIPMRRHRISRVQVEGEVYICDVGVGIQAPRRPLLFKEGLEQQQDGETYRLVRDPVLGWIVQFDHGGRWDNIYSFTEDVQYPIDFEMPNHWCLTHPDSIFKNYAMAYIRTPDGRKTIAESEDAEGKKVLEFRTFTPKGVDVFVPKTEEEYREALESYFGIVLD
ncbi:MAG TPA: arylamine N-acetyltransferase [Bacillota bacterium]|nr:arylamine N-acetyltransferase [Bacillota bacterium]